VGTFSWHFPYFAARYQLFPLFEEQPASKLDPKTWQGMEIEEQTFQAFLRCNRPGPAPVLVMLKGLTTGTVELFDATGDLLETHSLDKTDSLFQPVMLNLEGEDAIYRIRLQARDAKRWYVQYDAGTSMTVYDIERKHLDELHPRAYGFVEPGADKLKVKLEVEGEGFHMATLYDSHGNLVETVRKFVDFQDPGRYAMELEAEVGENRGDVWSLEIHDATVTGTEGLLPYWANEPSELFNPESLAKSGNAMRVANRP
jgi:hypothetical protein